MELKSLIVGLFLSIGAFAVKSGGGLGYVLVQAPGRARQAVATLAFMVMYAMLFGAVALLLLRVNLMAHIELLQDFFKSGMTLHFLVAILLLIWGVFLMKKPWGQTQSGRGWIPLVLPCPVCFTVVLLSCSFLNAVYPGRIMVFCALYAGFIIVSLTVAFAITRFVKTIDAAHRFSGMLMVYIAVYFILSIIVIPQFADLNKIYTISTPEPFFVLSREKIILILMTMAGLAAGFFNPFNKNKHGE
ncbi:MAG: DUF2162 domain-containing protein [Proteobacteria bacterium]|nr:DUF2162 domain-containing protein [Pseudomonadota bacterium]MBU1585235.1 DUF2162 domain-containing protein [Pseudomonadota bacterium]MBU2454548.1 DUF2162 domain-containing protein [Pseudomonadota bacterium]MBU2629125.1 DUF2162 domain-containing protein [Pseudomonadota bacterium]